MSITSLSKQTTLQVQNRQLKKQMESATEAKSTYMKYMGLRDTFDQLEEYDNSTMSLLNQIDEIEGKWKFCFRSCSLCSSGGTEEDHQCSQCQDSYYPKEEDIFPEL